MNPDRDFLIHRVPLEPPREGEPFIPFEQVNSPEFDFRSHFERDAIVIDGDWLVTRKTGSWANKDLMVVWAGEKQNPILSDFGPEGTASFRLLADCAEVLKGEDDIERVFVGYNINPSETQRKTFQSVKRFHAHVLGLTHEEVGRLEAKKVSEFEHDKPGMARQLVDPFVELFQRSFTAELDEIAKQNNGLQLIESGSHGLGWKASFQGGYELLSRPDFFEFAVSVDQYMNRLYQRIENLFTEGIDEQTNRPKLRSKEEIESRIEADESLDEAAKRYLSLLARIIKDAKDEQMNKWFLKGFAYNVAITEEDGHLNFQVAPRVISGLGVLEAIGIFLERTGDIKFSEEEKQARLEFYKKARANILKNEQTAESGPYIEELEEILRKENHD